MSVNKLVKTIKQEGQDFEFYPTTSEIINLVKASIYNKFKSYRKGVDAYSLLDCGAGDGRVLNELQNGQCYAIEKSSTLIKELKTDTYIVGTDFHETTLIDKEVDIIFCNPPYSEYEQWASKIIQEANAKHVYLVIPERWNNSTAISNAMQLREVNANVLGSFDFMDADRQARAKVEVVYIKLDSGNIHRDRLTSDPFDVWFNDNFDQAAPKKKETAKEHKEKIENGMTASGSLIKTLVDLYNIEMQELNQNFIAVSSLNDGILSELNVDINSIKDALKQRIKGLKNKYWRELFSNYTVINKKLTSKSLVSMEKRLFNNVSVDFTEKNCIAITGWVIKNANSYFDTQLIEVVENMVDVCNIINYKSNQRTWGDNHGGWRYSKYDFLKEADNYALDLRCILENQGGYTYVDCYSSWDHVNGLGKTGATTVNDLIVVANNLGFNCLETVDTIMNWGENRNQDILTESGDTLMNVKTFKNGNLHIKFNKKFIQKLNVEFGRLKGWLKDKSHASRELNIPEKDIDFNGNIQLGGSDLLMLGVY